MDSDVEFYRTQEFHTVARRSLTSAKPVFVLIIEKNVLVWQASDQQFRSVYRSLSRSACSPYRLASHTQPGAARQPRPPPMAMTSSDEDTIIILSTHYVRDPRERLVSTESTTQVTVGRTRRETLIARAVAVVSLSLLTISVLLVMVSLIMSHHIDQLGKYCYILRHTNGET